MPKWKATPRVRRSPRHTKYPRLASTECSTSPQFTEIDILSVDPSTLTNEQILHQQTIVSHKLYYATKVVTRALKAGRGFERQKLSRRLKAVKEGVNGTLLRRVEQELAILKEIDLEKVARETVRRRLGKAVKWSIFFPVEETMPGGWEGEKSGVEKQEAERARNDVVAVLCNTKPVREAVNRVVEVVKSVALSKRAPGKEEGVDSGAAQVRIKEKEAEDRGETEEEAEWSEWSGIQGSTGRSPQSLNSNRFSSTPTQLTKTCFSLIDPSRRVDEEWSGEDEGDDGDFNEDACEVDNGEASAEGKILEDELMSELEKFITPGTDSEVASDSETDNSHCSVPTTKLKPAIPVSTTNPVSIISSSSSFSHPPAPAKKKITSSTTTKTAKDTFLPSLMSRYISGSDSEGEVRHGYGYGPAQKKQRKNRMGQQARRALAQKIYKENAKHLKLGLGPARLPGVVTRGDYAGANSGGGGAGVREWGDMNTRSRDASVAQKPGRSKDNANEGGPLHPSWEAAKKAKQVTATVRFQGTKIKFE